MEQIFPTYYPRFRCIAGACRHSCCIGWEIDVDSDALAAYQKVEGAFGDRLRASISMEDTPHFRLDAHERCPFLNGEGLCDLILTLGEDRLCHICAEHPRFYNVFADREEVGLGLCCEAAGRLILGEKEPVCLIRQDGGAVSASQDPWVSLRDEVIALLQDRSIDLEERIACVKQGLGDSGAFPSLAPWCRRLLSLERLEDAWTKLLVRLDATIDTLDVQVFLRYMGARMTEYEQFLVYFVYRHAANAENLSAFCAWIRFAELGYRLLVALGAMLYAKTGDFTLDDQVELARLFSAEIEYSEENTEAILTLLESEE
ncbi:MAG: hypothetical protein E7637_01435 [Ruminococcaceae bacterium]|nr:hypothetical protein [Oscillospiraceae bacterium]